MKRATFLILLLVFVLARGSACAQEATGGDNGLPKEKQTTLRLYVTAQQAYEKWKASPESVKILDVRTPEEYVFVGHAPMAWNIPLGLQVYQLDPKRGVLPFKPNAQFLEEVKAVFKPTDVLLVMCRSGGRSAMAVNLLAQAGFQHVYNIVDGMEGDVVKDADSAYNAKRMKNGWKNSGAPWTYELAPEKIRWPKP